MTNDTIVNTVIKNFEKRSMIGYLKYGTTLDRNDLTYNDWIQHLQEELMDAILYLEKIKQNEIKGLPNNNQGSSNTNITSL
jgi:hypothetical protein